MSWSLGAPGGLSPQDLPLALPSPFPHPPSHARLMETRCSWRLSLHRNHSSRVNLPPSTSPSLRLRQNRPRDTVSTPLPYRLTSSYQCHMLHPIPSSSRSSLGERPVHVGSAPPFQFCLENFAHTHSSALTPRNNPRRTPAPCALEGSTPCRSPVPLEVGVSRRSAPPPPRSAVPTARRRFAGRPCCGGVSGNVLCANNPRPPQALQPSCSCQATWVSGDASRTR